MVRPGRKSVRLSMSTPNPKSTGKTESLEINGRSTTEHEPQTTPSFLKRAILKTKDRTSEKKRKTEAVREVEPVKWEQYGQLLCMGQNDVGQLGLGEDVSEKMYPTVVPGINDAVRVACGGMHTVVLTKDGKVFTFGCNDEGALGRNTNESNASNPNEGSEYDIKEVNLPAPAKMISAGDSHSAALLIDGRVYAWGNFRDSKGVMGFISGTKQLSPIEILEDIPFKSLASGSDHLLLLSKDGSVYSCGCGEQGQLGRVCGVFSNRESRRGISNLLEPAMMRLRRLHSQVITFDAIWAGRYTTTMRQTNGTIYSTGLNNFSQLALPVLDVYFLPEAPESFMNKQWKEIAGGQQHGLALDREGNVYAFGHGTYGRLGLGHGDQDATVPTKITTLDKKCVKISCGESVSYAITEEGQLYAWGMGTNHQLGFGSESDVDIPQKVAKVLTGAKVIDVSGGGQHTMIIAQLPTTNGN